MMGPQTKDAGSLPEEASLKTDFRAPEGEESVSAVLSCGVGSFVTTDIGNSYNPRW